MSNYVASLDFGSSKIALAVGRLVDNGIKIVSYNDAESAGIKNGEIIKDLQVTEAIRTLLMKAESDIGEPVEEVVIGIGGKTIHSSEVSCKVLRTSPGQYVTAEELSQITKARYNNNQGDETVYEVVPQRYNIDDFIGFSQVDIEGMNGKTIDASFKLFFGKNSLLARRRKIVEDCGLKVKKAILNPVAAARAVLTAQEMENGSVLVDIGKGVTEIVIVKDNIIKHIASIPFAGESITNDIKLETNTTLKWAETIKVKHGSCCSDFTPENKSLILRSPENTVDGEVELSLLSSVIEARTSEIFDAVRYIIEQNAAGEKLSAGVVLTGGTCYLENIQQLASAILGQKVRIAAPRGSITPDSIETAFDAYSSTAIGLILEGFDPMLSHAFESNTSRQIEMPAPVNQSEPEPVAPDQEKGIFTGEERVPHSVFRRMEKERKKAQKEQQKQEEAARKEKKRQLEEAERKRKEMEKKQDSGRSLGNLFSEFFSENKNEA